MIFETYTDEETKKVGYNMAKDAHAGDVYCLIGDLGVGKTIFTKGFAQGLGIDDPVTSPTFTLVNEYLGNQFKFYHFDVYRITDEEEMYEIGFEDYLYDEGVCLIEWANIIQDLIPTSATWITIEKDLSKGLDYRKITVTK